MAGAMKADLLVYATLADNLFQLLADIPIVDFAENRIVLLERSVLSDYLQRNVQQLHLERDARLVPLGDNPLLAVHVHNLVRGQFPDVCEAECGKTGKDEQVSGESKRGIGKLMLDKLPDFSLRKILPFLHVGRDTELSKRMSRYQTVVMRP